MFLVEPRLYTGRSRLVQRLQSLGRLDSPDQVTWLLECSPYLRVLLHGVPYPEAEVGEGPNKNFLEM